MIKDCVACLAQLAERKTEDLEVAGSTPAAGITFFFFLGIRIAQMVKATDSIKVSKSSNPKKGIF